MVIPTVFWVIFLFAIGASVGSFLNVVVHRLPHGMSIVRPGSRCTSCQKPIAWYDNIPIFSWFILRGRCRHCGAKFSIRYALVELFTAFLFVGLYWAYFQEDLREGLPVIGQGGGLVYAGHMVLICVLLASSLIDQEHWIIPLSLSYTAAVVGLVLSAIWPYSTGLPAESLWKIVPYASPLTALLALAGGVGLLIGLLLLKLGILKRSFGEWEQWQQRSEDKEKTPEPPIRIRREMLREIQFLLPMIVLGVLFYLVYDGGGALVTGWKGLILKQKWLAGLLGSVFGFIIGGGVVWATRILGSLAFGKEAMGLGDVHLMAAVGAVLGWISPTVAFFVAPFFGLGWALSRLFSHRIREIWYGPFLALATVLVMLAHDEIVGYFLRVLDPTGMAG